MMNEEPLTTFHLYISDPTLLLLSISWSSQALPSQGMDQTSSDTTPAVSLAEGAASESIDIGDAIIEDETHILPLIKDYRSILYLATVGREEDVCKISR